MSAVEVFRKSSSSFLKFSSSTFDESSIFDNSAEFLLEPASSLLSFSLSDESLVEISSNRESSFPASVPVPESGKEKTGGKDTAAKASNKKQRPVNDSMKTLHILFL
ncbi:MAG: hypothetical protein LBS06_03205 [Treponema sp.]|nr:hypothetical protein [Treponema sp.]